MSGYINVDYVVVLFSGILGKWQLFCRAYIYSYKQLNFGVHTQVKVRGRPSNVKVDMDEMNE